eukprot:CAMPEP_0205830028 /NCGR_PEP_ID=MMETSP0206-20130828/39876_1 /ASSEMBLY_ACC=CAM_ASM_000279 /TAXON_ID=36767 /ORGANISM="Euplotes focardii, Strain TN1" /LENGTH=98 /DNA_ID=CAMNT_0053133283 /DNA_START=230 /DNA_END=526 /DNA_ORIENTATION=+
MMKSIWMRLILLLAIIRKTKYLIFRLEVYLGANKDPKLKQISEILDEYIKNIFKAKSKMKEDTKKDKKKDKVKEKDKKDKLKELKKESKKERSEEIKL